MNATKRSLVNTDVTESASRFITPENGHEGAAVQPMKANRNIIPMLETPLKDYLPKTPGAHTPQDLNVSALSSNITPFTKMLEANLTGLDINQIPTPNIPITPNFPPFTPNVDFVSPFSNRPTDYSASSSYYQPSDNEQNKSLETQLREIEKKPTDDKTKNERLKNFNKNVIGKKNLNLMKRNVLSSSSSEDDSKSSSDSFCKDNNDTVIFSKSESPVQRAYSLRTRNIDKVSKADCSKKEVKKTPRKVVRRKAQNKEKGNEDENSINEKKTELQPSIVPEVEETDEKQTETAELNATTESTLSSKVEQEGVEAEVQTPPVKSKKSKTPKKSSKSTLTPSQLSLRKELEEKKKRMITNMKNDSKPQQKSAKKQNSAFKIKPIANLTNSKRKPRKAPTPKKALQADKEDLRLVMEDLEHSDDSDEEVPLPFKKAHLLTAEVTSSDTEAQTLIEGLKERGIHLMHNKSPKKKNDQDDPEDDQEDQEHPTDNEKVENSVTGEDGNEPSAATEQNISVTEFDSFRNEEFDIQVFDDFTETVVYDEKKCSRKSLQVDAIAELKQKKRSAEVFVEEINDFIRLDLVFTSLYTTYEFGIEDCEGAELKKAVENESTTLSKTDVENNVQEHIVEDQNASTQTDVKVDAKLIRKENLESHVPVPDDDLMNFALTGCDREESTDGHSTSSKKRKIKNEESSHSGKKCSTLLKKIDVDVFLDGIHGLDK
ncbi:unnamed protein product [Callosobruchus maculatus]|uniref:Uncharacterized protein n=1 Tax=Callosobruchus maculatus TaxID=64391 RepID=A0A653DLD5_CALMS|nr:unnamed protein product [Callosobruchus maculatus]